MTKIPTEVLVSKDSGPAPANSEGPGARTLDGEISEVPSEVPSAPPSPQQSPTSDQESSAVPPAPTPLGSPRVSPATHPSRPESPMDLDPGIDFQCVNIA